MFQPAFWCCKHPKAGRNTQQTAKQIFKYLSFQEVVFVSQDVNDNGFDVPVTCPQGCFIFHIVDGQSTINLKIKGKTQFYILEH